MYIYMSIYYIYTYTNHVVPYTAVLSLQGQPQLVYKLTMYMYMYIYILHIHTH